MAEVLNRKPLHRESKEWQCPHCTAVNNPADMDCRVCIKPKPGRSRLSSHLEEEQKRLPEEGPVRQSFADNVRSLVLGKPAPWRCPRCTCEMGGYYNKCTTCGFLKTDMRRKSDTSVRISDLFSIFRRSPDQSRRGSQQATSVDPDQDSGFQDSSVNNTVWACPICTYRNDQKVKVCGVCEQGKRSKSKKDGKKRKQHKTNDICESFEVINANGDEELIRVTPSLIETTDGPPFEDENNLSLPQFPSSSDTSAFVVEPTTELVLPHSSPQHILSSLPSSPPPPKPHPSTSTSTKSKPQTAFLSDPSTQSWKCSICGAFNLIFLPNQKCFVCGIGLIPNVSDIVDLANNRTHLHPGSLVVPTHPAPRPQAGHGELVYTKQPNAIAPLPSSEQQHSRVSDLPNGQVQPQRPTRLMTRKDQESGSRRRRRDNSIRRSAEDPLSTPGGNTTVLLRVEKRQYVLEADRIYEEICQYCKKVCVCMYVKR